MHTSAHRRRNSRLARRLSWFTVMALAGAALLTPGAALAGSTKGNNGTIKIHEQGTPSGTRNNDPKVCIFNVEGFGFDVGQTGQIYFDVQGGDGPTGTPEGPFAFGPADADGFYATQYFELDPGHYKATLYGKKGRVDEKAKSKVFKVTCAPTPGATPTPTPTPVATPTPTPVPTPTPTPTGDVQPTQGTPTPTPTPNGGVEGATGTPSLTLPPTDALTATPAAPSSDGWRLILMAMAGLLSGALLLTPAPSVIRKDRDR